MHDGAGTTQPHDCLRRLICHHHHWWSATLPPYTMSLAVGMAQVKTTASESTDTPRREQRDNNAIVPADTKSNFRLYSSRLIHGNLQQCHLGGTTFEGGRTRGERELSVSLVQNSSRGLPCLLNTMHAAKAPFTHHPAQNLLCTARGIFIFTWKKLKSYTPYMLQDHPKGSPPC